MRNAIKFTALAALVAPALAVAATYTFETPMEKSAETLWSTEESRISCSLSFTSPDYGMMKFSTLSGRNPQLSFEVFARSGIIEDSTMRLIAAPPAWSAGGVRRELGKIRLYKGFNPFVGDTVSWNMLGALRGGQQIILPYKDSKLANGDMIVPSLSPIGFGPAFNKFLNCRKNLINVGYDDVRMLAYAFTLQTDVLRPESLNRLKEQIEYATLDKSVDKIRISAFAYDFNEHDENIEMRKKRALKIKEAFVKGGVDEKIIEIQDQTSDAAEMHEATSTSYGAGVGSHHAIVYVGRDQYVVNRDLELQMPDIGKEGR